MSSYQSKVIRRISRAKIRGAGGKGSVLVRVSISPSGQLSAASIAKGSGNTRVDRAALGAVRRSGPFGATPNGQSVSYTLRINVRG